MYRGFWVLLLGMLTGSMAMAQDNAGITGKWYGTFKHYYGDKYRMIVQLEKDAAGGYKGLMELPDLAADEKFDLETVVYRKDTLLLRIDEVHFSYTGVWDPATRQFKGISSFGSDENEVNLGRKEITREDLYKRPQEPKPPYPYYTEEVRFNNIKDSVSLAGTFTRPAAAGRYPVVVMISGSGPQNRDEEIAGHKLFLVLADYFARNGIASLRFDDRGTGKSTGDYSNATIYDFAHDVSTASAYLKTRRDVEPLNVGLLGHSEGGVVAQIVAANNPGVAFVISMAGVGITGRQLIDQQMAIQQSMAGKSDSFIVADRQRMKPYWDLLASDSNIAVIRPKAIAIIRELYRTSDETVKKEMSENEMVNNAEFSPEVLSILKYNPLTYLKQVKCPFMAINGTKDIQVDATTNLNAIERALTENGNMLVTIRKFDGLNHLFQRCKTCTANEYGELEQTIDPLVPEFIAHWILQLP
ncbi:MAG: alpha/beta hydrolase [Chitinophaga sp.]|uniref:alpha/beta hydrolase family protein n=1 Tax=Chitinophaga sp. TaxID=1869181 RepID=UPI001B2AE390|nr:CocE/NonD family hydrolase [Chitinophaga sp.]MBO9728152.1 alpha/beta hydrolase [Chitinophaga sp.]